MGLCGFEIYHIGAGRNLIRTDGEPDLEDNPTLWRALWERHRGVVMAEHIRIRPGTRPCAWWMFDADGLPDRDDDEPEAEFLHRHDLLDPDELEAIRRKALSLVEYDRARSPVKTAAGFYKDHYIPPDDLHRFAAAHGLISEAEAAILGL